MNAQELLGLITSDGDSAQKAMDVQDFGASLLNPEQFNRFIQIMQDATVLLQESRRVDMTTPERVIDLTGIFEWVLRAGNDADGNHRDYTNEPGTKVTTRQNRLVARELIAKTGLFDKAARRNIEREQFENTLLSMLGGAAGRDMSAYIMLARRTYNYALSDTHALLSQTDGLLARAGSQIYGVESAAGVGDADFSASAIGTTDYQAAGTQARTVMQIMLETIQKKYIGGSEREFRYHCTWDFFDAYRELWISRGGIDSDSVLSGGRQPDYKGIPVVYAPELEREIDGNRHVLLSHPDNQNYGVFHEVTMEPDRIPGNRKTDMYLTFEGDVNYEDEFAAVAANLDTPKPA